MGGKKARAGDSLATRVFRGVNALFVRDDAELTAVIVHFTVFTGNIKTR